MTTLFAWVGLTCCSAIVIVAAYWTIVWLIENATTRTKLLMSIFKSVFHFYDSLPHDKLNKFRYYSMMWDSQTKRFIGFMPHDEFDRSEDEQRQYYRDLYGKLKSEGKIPGA